MSNNRLSSVRTAVQILKAFTSSAPSWGVTELSNQLGISKSTTHRVLSTLTDEGLLEQLPQTSQYRLGLVMFDLVAAVPSQRGLHEAVLQPLSDLRSATGETVQVGVLDERHVIYVERLDSPNTLRFFTELGRRNHAHCTASGKVLLAFSSSAKRKRLLDGWDLIPKTEFTIVSTAELSADLTTVRRQGFAENRHESEVGVVSMAAPIRDARGITIASMSVAGPVERMDRDSSGMSEAVRKMAAVASKRLSHS